MKKFWKKLPRWGKILARVLAGIVGLILLCILGFKAWTLTWKTYTNDEFGFSFRYPRGWYIGGTDITGKQLDERNVVYFWVDTAQPDVVGGITELARSQGNVTVELEKNTMSTTIDARRQQGVLQYYKIKNFGKASGYVFGISSLADNSNGKVYMFSKELLVETSSYTFVAKTLTFSDNRSVLAQIQARVYYLVGSGILNSFFFSK